MKITSEIFSAMARHGRRLLVLRAMARASVPPERFRALKPFWSRIRVA